MSERQESKAEASRYCLSYREQRYAAIQMVIPDVRIRLYEKVDPDRLLAAIREAMNDHPLYRTHLIRDQGLYWFVKNEKDPVITKEEWDQPLVFGTEEKHGYPWAITYSDDLILFTATHALADIGSINTFLKTVLIRYFQIGGVGFPEHVLRELPHYQPEEDCTNPYERLNALPVNPAGAPRFPQASPLPKEAFETDPDQISAYQVVFDLSEILQAAGVSETSLFSVIACLLARAVENAFEMQEGTIEVRVPVDLRPRFSMNTEHNFVYGFSLNYDVRRMKQLPCGKVETAFRSQMDLYADRDNLLWKMKQEKKQYDALLQHPEALDELPLEAETIVSPTAKIMYSHITKIGFPEELDDLLAEYGYVTGRRADPYLLFMAMTRRSRIELAIQQSTKKDLLITALKEEAQKRGFHCEIRKCRARPVTVFRPEGL